MTNRITRKNLDNLCEVINNMLDRSIEPYELKDNRIHKAVVGNFHIIEQSGLVQLAEMTSEGGGVVIHLTGLTKRECWELMTAFIAGLRIAEKKGI